jgi:hypothetical protein
MAAKKALRTEDRSRAIRIVLQGIAAGVDFADLARQLEVLHPKNDTFPGEVFLGNRSLAWGFSCLPKRCACG